MPEAPPTLDGISVRLRPLDAPDLPRLVEILMEPEIARWWGDYDADRVRADFFDDREVVAFGIEIDGELAELVQYGEETEPDYRNASIDILLHPHWHGRGHGSDALRTLCRYLVADRGHPRIVIDPAATNTRAIRSYEWVGFKPGRGHAALRAWPRLRLARRVVDGHPRRGDRGRNNPSSYAGATPDHHPRLSVVLSRYALCAAIASDPCRRVRARA